MESKREDEFFIYDCAQKRGIKAGIKNVLYKIEGLFYEFESLFIKKNVEEKKYNVSICAIFKNEAIYLKEWIEFNALVGIDHFYMYNNNSEDDYLAVLTPYISSGLVTLEDWPYDHMQMECYVDCICKYSPDTKWLGFIDIDEFVVPKTTENIYDFLKVFEKKRGSVRIYWRLFGSGGLMDRDLQGFVTEDFTICWPKYCNIGKCFYNTAFEFDTESKHISQLHHKLWTKWKGQDIPPVNIFNKFCVGNRNIAKSKDFPIQINHYFTKSYKEFMAKCSKGDVYFEKNPHDEAYFYEHEMKCDTSDFSAYKYLVKMKLAMRK